MVISRTILVNMGGNDLLCYLVPNSRNQRQARDVIRTKVAVMENQGSPKQMDIWIWVSVRIYFTFICNMCCFSLS